MTKADSIPIEELGSPNSDVRRDQWGRYLVLPPGEDKPVGYTRVTTVAKTLDSGGGLAPWKAAMTAAGIIMRRGLRAQWEALLAEYGDPWYAGTEAKSMCRQLVEECAAVGGANDRKEVGSALHAITCLVDVGKTPKHLTAETKRDVEAYVTGLAEANVTIMPGMVELVTVLDKYRVAGTFDRLANVPGFELPLIADLKTGENLEYSWQSIAVQMAAYSRGDALYQQGTAKDGSLDVRHPMPKINQDWGLIMHLAATSEGEAKLELYLVDLNAGWEAFEHSLWTRNWRNTAPARKLTDNTPIEVGDGDMAPALEASVATTKARKARKNPQCDNCEARHCMQCTGGDCTCKHRKQQAPVIDLPEPEPDPLVEDSLVPEQEIDVYQTRLAVRLWLQGRIDDIGKNEKARAALVTLWPVDMPTLRAAHEHDDEQLQQIESILDVIEKDHSLGFPVAKPVIYVDHDATVAKVVDLFAGSTKQQTRNIQP